MKTSKRHKTRLKRQIDISKTGEKNLEKQRWFDLKKSIKEIKTSKINQINDQESPLLALFRLSHHEIMRNDSTNYSNRRIL